MECPKEILRGSGIYFQGEDHSMEEFHMRGGDFFMEDKADFLAIFEKNINYFVNEGAAFHLNTLRFTVKSGCLSVFLRMTSETQGLFN